MQAELLDLKAKYGHQLHLKKAPPTSSTFPFPIVVSWALDAPKAAEAYDISLVKVLRQSCPEWQPNKQYPQSAFAGHGDNH